MKLSTKIILVNSITAVLVGCGSGTGSSSDSTVTALQNNVTHDCGSAFPDGSQPDRASIENLFGCVTLGYVSADGEDVFRDTVVFTAEDEGDTILGNRTLTAIDGRTAFFCAELAAADEDFLCVTSIGLSTEHKYEFTMNSQFEGTGTHQLCFEAGNCGLDGVDFPITSATISIVRDGTVATESLTLNDMPISETEASERALSDALLFDTQY